MVIKKIIPQGFCYGVMSAYNNAIKTIENNPHKKIYMLGWLVHNQKVIDDLSARGITILDDNSKSRYEIIQALPSQTDTILILSAHGTDYQVIDLAHKKGFEIVDLTCKYVYKTHELIKTKLAAGYQVIFIGKASHAETNAILKIDSQIILVENEDDIKNLTLNSEKIFCTNQTTLSYLVLQNLTSLLKSKFPNIEVVNDICLATKVRQEAVMNMDKDIDICIVIGDYKSSNSNELYHIAQSKVQSYFVNDIKDIDCEWFNDKQCCAITAGASTPSFLIDRIIKYIDKEINHA